MHGLQGIKSGPILRRGIAHFNAERYFEAHEAFEDLWRAESGARRPLYQGLTQACAGLVKHQRGQPGPAATLLRRGLDKLEAAPPACRTGIDLPSLIRSLRDILDALAAGRPFEAPVMIPDRGPAP